jgi:hypothetical protein
MSIPLICPPCPRRDAAGTFIERLPKATPGAQETLANAAKISSGGAPLILFAEEETFLFNQIASA